MWENLGTSGGQRAGYIAKSLIKTIIWMAIGFVIMSLVEIAYEEVPKLLIAKSKKDAFSLFDKDNDEAITNKELGTVIESLGQTLTEAELQAMIDELDTDDSKNIDFEEFQKLFSEEEEKDAYSAEELVKAWKVFKKAQEDDSNNFGTYVGDLFDTKTFVLFILMELIGGKMSLLSVQERHETYTKMFISEATKVTLVKFIFGAVFLIY